MSVVPARKRLLQQCAQVPLEPASHPRFLKNAEISEQFVKHENHAVLTQNLVARFPPPRQFASEKTGGPGRKRVVRKLTFKRGLRRDLGVDVSLLHGHKRRIAETLQ